MWSNLNMSAYEKWECCSCNGRKMKRTTIPNAQQVNERSEHKVVRLRTETIVKNSFLIVCSVLRPNTKSSPRVKFKLFFVLLFRILLHSNRLANRLMFRPIHSHFDQTACLQSLFSLFPIWFRILEIKTVNVLNKPSGVRHSYYYSPQTNWNCYVWTRIMRQNERNECVSVHLTEVEDDP